MPYVANSLDCFWIVLSVLLLLAIVLSVRLLLAIALSVLLLLAIVLSVLLLLVSMLASSAVDCGFEPLSGQTKDYVNGICCFSA